LVLDYEWIAAGWILFLVVVVLFLSSCCFKVAVARRRHVRNPQTFGERGEMRVEAMLLGTTYSTY